MLKARQEAEKQHATQPGSVVWRPAEQSVPTTDPHWTQLPGGQGKAGTLEVPAPQRCEGCSGSASLLRQGKEHRTRKDENLSAFLEKVSECLRQYTTLDSEDPGSAMVVNTHLLSQSAPDIYCKLPKTAVGPNTPPPNWLRWTLGSSKTGMWQRNKKKTGR